MGYSKEQRLANAKKIADQQMLNETQTVNVNDNKETIKVAPVSSSTTDNKIVSKKLKREIPLNTLVEVKNGFHGTLVYASKRTVGYTVIFNEFGDKEYFELQELISARNSYKKFFENNWFLIDDIEILEFLGVAKFYENAFNTENFNEIFNKTPEDIEKRVKKLSEGQRNTLIFIAKEFIDNGTIDSRKTIDALEKALEVELIER